MVRTLRERLRQAGAASAHERRLLTSWLAGEALNSELSLPSQPFSERLHGALPELCSFLADRARVLSRHASDDGSVRLLVGLADGGSVETVLLGRRAVCVSTQLGCAVGCRFCKTGEGGLLRQLSSLEIAAQVALARRERGASEVRRVVLMGMGEPAHNLAAVIEAIEVLGMEGRVPHKEIVFSTVGDPAAFERLERARVRPALALSLHTLDAELRAELLPRAPRVDPHTLLEAALAYSRSVHHPLQIQWTLLDGVNDDADSLAGLAEVLAGERAIVNLIPWNRVEGISFASSPIEIAVEHVRALKRAGVRATIRRSAGDDVEAACGQLRARRAPVGGPARVRRDATVG